MNINTTVSKSVGVATIIALIGVLLGSLAVPSVPARASDVLLASVAITASPGTICAGQSALLTWSSTDATSIWIDQGIGSVFPFGDRSVSPTQTTTYTITGSNGTGGYATAAATVTVSGSCATPTPPVQSLHLSPLDPYINSGETVTFHAWGGNGSYTWRAHDGFPFEGFGSYFTTRFYNYTSRTVYYDVIVTSGGDSAYARVGVYPSATPTPWPSSIECSPSFTDADSGDRVRFTASGGDGSSYSWSAPDGSPDSGTGSSFSTRFYNYSNYDRDFYVTVTNTGWYYGQSDTCRVRVSPSSYYTPTPSPYGWLGMEHSVRNLTRGGEGSSVTASNGDRLQFITRITTGNRTAEDVHIRDWLPWYLTYVSGSTTVDGSYYQDGIATGADSNSLALGDLSRNRTYVVRFDATLSGAPNTTLTNSVNVQARNAGLQNRTSAIYVSGRYVTPVPTWTWTPAPTPEVRDLSLTLTGRNTTRGQTGEYRSVSARGGDTIAFILRVRAPWNTQLTNVRLTDYLPSGLTYNSTTTTRDGIAESDGITAEGLSLGTLSAGQEVVIKFSARVEYDAVPEWGTVTVTDSAQVRADGVNTKSASMRITLGTDESLTAVSAIKTGPADALWLSLLIALMATGLYAAYTRTDLFGRRMTDAEISALQRRSTLNFSR